MKEYIEREAVKNAFCASCSTNKRYHRTNEECRSHTDSYGNGCFKMRLIDSVPAADVVERKRGEWTHPKGYVVSNGFVCSECGHEEASYHPINPRPNGGCVADEHGNFYHPPKINFCPNCGADMRKTEDNHAD